MCFKEILKLSKRDPASFEIKSLHTTVRRAVYVYQLLNENLQNARQSSITYIESIINFQETLKNKTKKSHILISSVERYKSKTTATNEIIKQLEVNGFKTYLNWSCDISLIGSSVENATCIIIIISQSFSIDEFCRFEALQSIKLSKPIIPIILKGRYSLEEEKEWLLEMIIPNQPYIWFDADLNEEGFERLFDKISLYGSKEKEDNLHESEMKVFITNLGIKKRKCFKIVFDKENMEK